MSEKKERFGRYLILDHLVDGGMAKICRARFLGEQADKIVAIKMIQPQYSSDESFKSMFMDEIKVTFGLLHPNIVQTYDYGLHKDQLFVAMEYCDGRNLKEYLDRLRQKKFVFPVEISVYIISQVCQGLHYSHTFTDKLTGKQANIIHRDISPHNIMLTYDGAVKIIDFGIAKANTNSEATKAGTIKGKLSYLAPEYLDGLQLDARYDMFAVGITLWEMLCSRKLFKAANDLAVLKKIQECKVPPPSKINPNVPKELDEIVLQALRKDRNKRFENMDQFNRALIKFLYANYPDFNSSDLSYFAKELFKDEIKKDREKLFEFGKIDIKPYIDDWKREQEGGISSASEAPVNPPSDSSDNTGTNTQTRKQEQVLDFGFEEETATKTGLKKQRQRVRVAAKPRQDAKNAAVEVIDAENMRVSTPRAKKIAVPPPSSSNGPSAGRRRPRKGGKKSGTRTGTGTVDIGEFKGGAKSGKLIALIAVLVIAIYFGRNDIPYLNEFIGNRGPASGNPSEVHHNVPNQVKIDDDEKLKLPTKDSRRSIRIENFDSSLHRVYVNSEEVKPDFLKKVPAQTGKEHFVRVERAGFIPFTKRVKVPRGEVVNIIIPAMQPASFGYLYTSRGCSLIGTISFELYGESRTVNLPLPQSGLAFPVKGDGRTPADDSGHAMYTVYFKKRNSKGVERKLNFSFKEDEERVDLCRL